MLNRRVKFILSTLFALGVMLVAGLAFAEETAEIAIKAAEFDMKKWIGLACGLGIAIAVFGGALGQSRAASSALDGIARNPGASGKIFTPMILALALIESLVIYSLIISFVLVGKI